MRILFLTNLLPYPLDNGGKIKTFTTVSGLANTGHVIDLVCFTEQENPEEKPLAEMMKFCHRINQVYMKLTTVDNMKYMMLLAAKSLFSRYSFGLYKYQSKEMRNNIEILCREVSYDCIYFDHLQMCVYEPFIRKIVPNVKMVLDEHNCEALIMSRNASLTKNILKKTFLQLECKKLGNFESKMLQQMDTNIVLSLEDYAELKKLCNKEFKHTIIPIGVQDYGIKKVNRNSINQLNILFLGTLTWQPNNQGILWFLTEVVPLLEAEDKDYSLYIVGKNPSQEVQKISEQYKNIIVTGYVESVDEYYDRCDCMVVPLFIGSGQRVKLIEAFSRGMPAISTTIGAEGLKTVNCDNILIANTAVEFKDALYEMYDFKLRERVSGSARECYEKNYSPIAVAKILDLVLKQVLIS